MIPSVSLKDGGPSIAIAAMERALTSMGVEVTTATTDSELSFLESPVNGATRVYARKRSEFYKVAPAIVPWLIANISKFDVVHIHALFSFTSTVAAWIARSRRVPYIVRPLGTLTSYGVRRRRPGLKKISLALAERHIIENAAAVHFTSQLEWEEADKLNIPFRGVVIPIGIPIEADGCRTELSREFPLLSGRSIILYISRLDPKKNIEGLIAAFASSRRLREGSALAIAGSGDPVYVLRLKDLANAAGIASQVVWLGHVTGNRKSAAFAAADLFVLPSFSENFGIAVVEALYAGVPCVLGEGVAIAGDVQASGAGLAVPAEPAALAAAMEKILSDRTVRNEMGARGKALALREYSLEVMARRLVDLYRESIAAAECVR